ncbi:MAG TPA: RlmE family RNA methyltransferase, partial [Stellaceae bacterium]|nr:RlmE family RNA methyltransferase [Stellaceae bacterium]
MAGEDGRSRDRGRRGPKRSCPPVTRNAAVRVRSARRRKPSSTEWLSRQLNDPYVAEARRLGYRSRAAFKLIELDDRFQLLLPGRRVVDLGCAPGGWTQVAVERVGERGIVVGVDLAETAPIAGAKILHADVHDPAAVAAIRSELGGLADVVLSDMAPSTTGHAATDHVRIVALAEAAFAVASEILKSGGVFVAKVFQGGAEGPLLAQLK